jgi:neutral ceramidase
VVSGYANEYASYFTTPEEYGAQHYEGGTTVYGPASGPFLTGSLADLARRLVRGRPAPAPHRFDPVRGLRPSAGPYPSGAARGRLLTAPAPVAVRLDHASLRWRGGASGTDRPLDRAFVSVQRLAGRRWHTVDTDLGLRLLWRVDDDRPKLNGAPRYRSGELGTYTASWEPPPSAPAGRYRFVVTARRYRLASRPFRLRPARNLVASVQRAGTTATIRLSYPPVRPGLDFTARPPIAENGEAEVSVDGRAVTVRIRHGTGTLQAPPDARITIGAARDGFGNSVELGQWVRK